jgi:sugar lactone lactonase YvrE
MNILKSLPVQCVLAEGPLWHAGDQAFYWVDIEGKRLYRYNWDSAALAHWDFEQRVTFVQIGKHNKLILGLDRDLVRFDPLSKKVEYLIQVDEKFPANRCNDAKADASGRLWVGTMSTAVSQGAGSLYRIGSGMDADRMLDNLTIGNGMAWSEDGKSFFYIDSPTRAVQKFQFDPATGQIQFDRIVVQVPEALGMPDGMTIDRQGRLWVAIYGGAGVYVWDSDSGELIQKIEIPAPHVTSCAFVGEALDMLMVTTAREYLSEEALAEFPESGNVFFIKVDAQGYAPNEVDF